MKLWKLWIIFYENYRNGPILPWRRGLVVTSTPTDLWIMKSNPAPGCRLVAFKRKNFKKRSGPILWVTFFMVKVMLTIWQKCVGLYFGRFFHKLVWSPWPLSTQRPLWTLRVWVCDKVTQIFQNAFSDSRKWSVLFFWFCQSVSSN
jgi:hypothetical protein